MEPGPTVSGNVSGSAMFSLEVLVSVAGLLMSNASILSIQWNIHPRIMATLLRRKGSVVGT